MNHHLPLTLRNSISTVKVLPLLTGAMVLTLSATTIPAAFAQSTTPPEPPPPPLEQQNWLNLTPEQQEKMKQIREAERQQMDSILTAEQKARLQAAREKRENPRQAFESLNLTAEQKTKIQQVHRASRQQMDAILTAQQRQLLQQRRPPKPPGLPPQ